MTAVTQSKTLTERLEPYIAIIGPMVMILAILCSWGRRNRRAISAPRTST